MNLLTISPWCVRYLDFPDMMHTCTLKLYLVSLVELLLLQWLTALMLCSLQSYVLDVHPFNPRIAMSAGYDGRIIVWDVSSWLFMSFMLTHYSLHARYVIHSLAISFSRSGRAHLFAYILLGISWLMENFLRKFLNILLKIMSTYWPSICFTTFQVETKSFNFIFVAISILIFATVQKFHMSFEYTESGSLYFHTRRSCSIWRLSY